MNLKRFILIAAAVAMSSVNIASAQSDIKWYGFIRNYMAFDSRESVAGTGDLFLYLPKDHNMSGDNDLNANPNFSFLSITSRLGVDVSGYEFEGWKMGAKIETDFYSGLSGVTGTATLRLRQAYLTASKNGLSYKMGQAWHPMGADFPDVFGLNTGAPFGAFNRSPLAQLDYKLSGKWSLTAAAIWQQQYTSSGPNGAKADYMKYGLTPEIFLGVNYKSGAWTAKLGVDMLSIKPRNYSSANVKVDDRITTLVGFAFLKYEKDLLSFKAKASFGEAGEHLNLNSGYAVAKEGTDLLGSWNYTPIRQSSSWLSLKYGKTLQAILFAGYAKSFGTAQEILSTQHIYFYKNSFSNYNQMYRLTPAVLYNFGKLALGLEFEMTSVQYGSWGSDSDKFALATKDLHWVTNNRIQAMVKYTF